MSVLDTFTILFKTNSKEAEKEVKQVDKATTDFQENIKKTDGGIKQLGVSFMDLTTAAVAALGAVFAVGKIKDGIMGAINFNAELEKQSRLTGLSADEISAWGGAVAAAGGDAAGFSAWLAKLNEQYSEQGLGGRIKNVLPNLIALADQFKHLKDIGEHAQALALGEKLGITPDMVLLLEKGSNEVAHMVAEQEKLAPLTKQNAEAAQKFSVEIKNLERSATGLFTELEPLAEGLLHIVETVALAARGVAIAFKDIFAGNWKHLFSGGKEGNEPAAPALPSLTGRQSSGAAKSNRDESIAFWLANGYSPAQAAALAANEQRESNFNPNAVGDGGQARGAFQWHPDRQRDILKNTGIDVTTASHADQLKAANYELGKGIGNQLKGINDPGTAADFVSRKFERPANADFEASTRAAMARDNYNEIMSSMMADGKSAVQGAEGSPFSQGGGNGSKEVNMRIDNITINTQATDADGIAKSLNDSLIQHYRTTAGNADDGISY